MEDPPSLFNPSVDDAVVQLRKGQVVVFDVPQVRRTLAGSQGLLTLLVTRTVEPRTHEEFWRQKLYRHLAPLPHLGIEVTPLGGRAGS